ncbi:MAG: RdgB/HAM1 family non-canonical purine NTP pyrophosphatase [Actinobacteria bacterium]|nr:RdgB/HAM1 family non-canonical purine NTP pyrophosphatase [Actinomycetota bacterium]
MELVFATGNQHKLAEAKSIFQLRNPKIELSSYGGPSPIESGITFVENARIKALAAHQATGKTAFADDSGICVDVMGGAPGIFSAGWSGSRSDEKNRLLLLSQLSEIPQEHRAASFVCSVSLIGVGLDVSFTGVWLGSVAFAERGTAGFGYDSIFIPEGFDLTAAELDPELKNSLSHRFLAMSQLADYLSS